MSERKVYFCDWCDVQAPTAGSVGPDWVVLDVFGSSIHEHLCQPCNNARLDALGAAKRSRRPKAGPVSGSVTKKGTP
jgi:hypothetical protein